MVIQSVLVQSFFLVLMVISEVTVAWKWTWKYDRV